MIYDHLGNQWFVGSGEPASKIVSRLKRKNYDYIVLPVKLLATGVNTEEVHAEGVIPETRLRDCLQVLKEA